MNPTYIVGGIWIAIIIFTMFMVISGNVFGVPIHQTEFEWTDDYRDRVIDKNGDNHTLLCPGTSGLTFTVNVSDYYFSQEYFDSFQEISCPFETSQELVNNFEMSINNALEYMNAQKKD